MNKQRSTELTGSTEKNNIKRCMAVVETLAETKEILAGVDTFMDKVNATVAKKRKR